MTTRRTNGRIVATATKQEHVMLSIYRYQLSALIETERGLVALGLLKPEERRVLSRDEQRQLTQNFK